MEYSQKESNTELSALEVKSKNIYHTKGAYEIITGQNKIIPVNRSYSADGEGDRNRDGIQHKRDSLIHERVMKDSILKDGELLVSVYGKDLLFLESAKVLTETHAIAKGNQTMSESSKKLTDGIANTMYKEGFGEEIVGVFGSHQVGLQSTKSDIDLIIWSEWENKEEVEKVIKSYFSHNNFVESPNDYASKYAKKFSIPSIAGVYLAEKRNRWISSSGVPVSMQILNKNYNHDLVKDIINDIDNEYHVHSIELTCKIRSITQSYNFPRIWELEYKGDIIRAISFSWSHQGMEDDKNRFGEEYVFKGHIVRNNRGSFLYLRDEFDYIIPKRLL